MIDVFIKGQELKIVSPIIASGTINYLELTAHFETDDWDDMDEIFAIFEKDNFAYQVKLNDSNMITKDKGLNLKSGVYKVHFVGKTIYNDDLYSRITTEKKDIVVIRSGKLSGEEFPTVNPSERDEILKTIGNLSDLKTSDKSSIVKAINEIFSSQLKPEISIVKDWNENDPESPYFIKNRTHYVDGEIIHKLDNKFLNIDKKISANSDNAISNSAVAQLEEKVNSLGENSQSGNSKNFRLINEIKTTEEINRILIENDLDGNPFSCNELVAFVTGYASGKIIRFSTEKGSTPMRLRITCPTYNLYLVTIGCKLLAGRRVFYAFNSRPDSVDPNLNIYSDESITSNLYTTFSIEQFDQWSSINFPIGTTLKLYGR